MIFQEFSSSLEEILQKLDHGLDSENGPIPFRWAHGNNENYLKNSGNVVIGLGDYAIESTDPEVLLINNKNPAFGREPSYTSVIRMLQDMGPEDWKRVNRFLSISNPETPDQFLSRRLVFVEDASPDSVFSCYFLMMTLAGVENPPHLTSYINPVDLWEQGNSRIGGKFPSNWPLLQSALAHLHFSIEDDVRPGERDHRSLSQAWIRSLQMLHHVVKSGFTVADIPEHDTSVELEMARNALDYEYQLYENALKRSETLQISVPLKGVKERRKLVDAFFLAEEISTGIGKIYIRNDRIHSHFKKGFEFLAMYRPHLAGTGNDLTASADPKSGLDLTDLWVKLEQMEWERNENRAADQPRKVKWLNNLQEKFHIRAGNEPWYMVPSLDLVAAPKAIRKSSASTETGSTPGTQISWTDFNNAIWKLYHPARDIIVTELHLTHDRSDAIGSISLSDLESLRLTSGTPAPLIDPSDLSAENRTENDSGKKVRIFQYHKNSKGLSFLPTPTMKRIFAALIPLQDRKVELSDLPEESEYDFSVLHGGFFIVHDRGVVLFDDWNEEKLNVKETSKELLKAIRRYEFIEGGSRNRGFKKEIQSLREKIFSKKYQNPGSKEKLLRRLNEHKIELDRIWLETAPDPIWKEMRSVVERRWGLNGALEDLYESVDRLESTLRTISDLRTGKLIFLLSFYGFPFLFFGSFFAGSIFENWIKDSSNSTNLLSIVHKTHWAGLIVYFGLSVLMIAFFKFWNWLDHKK